MLDNAKVSTAATNSFGTSAHETGINISTLTPYEYFHSMGIDLQGFSIHILRKRRKNGVAITGVFNISGIYYTVGAEDYEHLLVDLLERYRKKRAYHKRCQERKRERNMLSFINRYPDAMVLPAYFPDLHLSHQLYALFPVVTPSGIIVFTFRFVDISFGFITLVSYDTPLLHPPDPLE